MILIGPPSAIAPQISGVASGLPEPRALQRPDQKISEPAKKDATRNDTSRQTPQGEHTSSSRAMRKGDGDETTAPPTILQLKINEMLREQAEQLEERIPGSEDPADRQAPHDLPRITEQAEASGDMEETSRPAVEAAQSSAAYAVAKEAVPPTLDSASGDREKTGSFSDPVE